MFLALGVTFALRMSFSLVLTQMVYIPNANTENHTIDSNGEEICPTRYPEKPQNVSSSVCEIQANIIQFKNITLEIFSSLEKRGIDFSGRSSYRV